MGPTCSSPTTTEGPGCLGSGRKNKTGGHDPSSAAHGDDDSPPPPPIKISRSDHQEDSTAATPALHPSTISSFSAMAAAAAPPTSAAAPATAASSGDTTPGPPLTSSSPPRRPLREMLFLDAGTQGQRLLLPFLRGSDLLRLSECSRVMMTYRHYLPSINVGLKRGSRPMPPGLVQLLSKQAALSYLRAQSPGVMGSILDSLQQGAGSKLRSLDLLSAAGVYLLPMDKATALGSVLAQGACPCLERIRVGVGINGGDAGGAKVLVALSEGACPGLIDLSLRLCGEMAGELLATTLRSPHLRGLQLLNLSTSELSGDGVRAVAEALRSGSCRALRVLQLNRCGLDGGGAASLGAALRAGSCPLLEELDLGHNDGMGDEGVIPLVKALEEGHCLAMRRLKLEAVGMGMAGGLALAVALSARACVHLERFDVGINKNLGVAVEELLHHLGSGAYPALRLLNLTNCGMGREGMLRLVQALAEGAWPVLEVIRVPCNIEMGGDVGLSLASALEGGAGGQVKELDMQCTFLDAASSARLAAVLKAGALPMLEALMVDEMEGVDWRDAVSSRAKPVKLKEFSICG